MDYSALKHDKCDKYDYLIAVGSGAIAGLIDVFLVGSPKDSTLGNWTDNQVDGIVKKFAKSQGWAPRGGNEENVGSAIGFLEGQFKVNYDQRYTSDVGNIFNMSTRNHHLKSLSHSPDIIGLFFSVLDQFTGTSTFIDNGSIIRIRNSETFELQGGNFLAKLFCAITNWFGHLISDIAGSSGGRPSGRGSGISIPFYELFGLCNFGGFTVGGHRQTVAKIATRVFEEGYDLRFGITMTIPVILNELVIRLVWALKRYFYHKKQIKQCMPTMKNNSLRVMLILGQGTLCAIDGLDASLRSGGNVVMFICRMNIIAWFRFIMLVIKEVSIRCNIVGLLEWQLESYKKVNHQIMLYIEELKKIDIEAWKKEIDELKKINNRLFNAKSEEEVVNILYDEAKYLNLELPFSSHDEFLIFMEKDEDLIL
ncbi:MAG: hypothetical protein ACRC28_11765 [Clostridium sp.]|uniref:hypothetical protein n=1 Tax=Clostridium sp. TaxID=1506 RepID=UPI003F2DCE7C